MDPCEGTTKAKAKLNRPTCGADNTRWASPSHPYPQSGLGQGHHNNQGSQIHDVNNATERDVAEPKERL